MDESAQQAIQLGVNTMIFVIALTISISIMLGVRDVADKAYKYNASIPSGSRTVAVEENKQRTVTGNELLAYYANYMTDINNLADKKFNIVIKNADETKTVKNTTERDDESLKKFFTDNRIDLNKEYEVTLDEYNASDDVLTVILKEI